MALGGRPLVAPVARSAAKRFLLGSYFVFGLIEALSIARDFALGDITDPWLALFPLVWINLALLVLLLLSLGFLAQTRFTGGRARGWRAWLVPRFETLAAALRPGPLRARILLIGIAYAIVLSFLQGIIVVDPSGALLPDGTAYPVFDVAGGPIGWGPKLLWAPNPFFGVLLRPYTVAATALLSSLAAVGLGLMTYRRGRDKARTGVRGFASAFAGGLVVCPACAASPATAFLGSLVAGGAAGGVAVGSLVAVSTVMLFVSVTAMWIGIARVSQSIAIPTDGGRSASEERSHGMGNWLMAAALLFAVGSLLVDLSAAQGAGGHAHGEAGEVVAHPAAALAIGALSTLLAFAAVSVFRSHTLPSRRRVAVVVALGLLFADGVVHLLAVLDHVGAPFNAAFFLVVGFAQVLGVFAAAKRDKVLWWIGVPLSIFLVAAYVARPILPPPFEAEANLIEPFGLLSKGLEVLVLLALVAYFGRAIVPARARTWFARIPTQTAFTAGLVAAIAALAVDSTFRFAPPAFLVAFALLAALGIALALGARYFEKLDLRRLTWLAVGALFVGHLAFLAYHASGPDVVPLFACVPATSVLGIGLFAPLAHVLRGDKPFG